ncbi:MAG: hypothetical protein HQK66_09125 [Desulfamplus sp.]|nr:hypothetical protein [Desulfamplus sp.]
MSNPMTVFISGLTGVFVGMAFLYLSVKITAFGVDRFGEASTKPAKDQAVSSPAGGDSKSPSAHAKSTTADFKIKSANTKSATPDSNPSAIDSKPKSGDSGKGAAS